MSAQITAAQLRRIDREPVVLSKCGQYRYWWSRPVSDLFRGIAGPCVFLMLNPSTADGENDDNTTRRCRGFAEALGADRVGIINLFALRSRNPGDLYAAADPVGPLNDEIIMEIACWVESEGGKLICGWGATHGDHLGRAGAVLELLRGIPLHYLKLNDDGSPTHPLYLPGDLRPIRWEAAAACTPA